MAIEGTKNFSIHRINGFDYALYHRHILVAEIRYVNGDWIMYYNKDYMVFGFSFEEQEELTEIFEQINKVVF